MLRLFEEWNEALLSLTQAPVRSSVADLRPFLELCEPAAVHPPVQAARLQWHLELRGAAVEERFRFRSPLRSGYPRNDFVKGQRWRRDEARLSGTALLMLHAAFAPNNHPERVYSRTALERGAHVFVISLPYHIFRRPRDARYSGQYLFSGDVPRLIYGIVQAAADARAMVLGLRHALGYRRVLVYGVGFGGLIAALAAARVELDGLFLVAPWVDPFVALWQTPLGEPLKRAAQTAGFRDDLVREAMHCVTPILLGPPQLKRRRIEVVYGTDDMIVPEDAMIALLQAWNQPPARALQTGHRLIATRAPQLRQRLGDWVDEMRAPATSGRPRRKPRA